MIALPVIVLIIAILLWLQYWTHASRLLLKFPQIGPVVPLLGHVHLLNRKKDTLFVQLRRYTSRMKQTFCMFGSIYGTLHIVTAEDAEILLSNPKYIDKGYLYTLLHPWLGTGLLTSTGTKWHHRRRMLTPAFHYNILQMFVEVFGERCEKLIEQLQQECKTSKTNIVPIMTQTALETICETSMGIKLDENYESQSKYCKAIHTLIEVFLSRVLSPWLYPNILYYISPMYWKEKGLVTFLHNFTNKIIKRRQETFQESDITDLESTNTKPKKRLAMLDILIHANRHLGEIDDDGIREEVDTFAFEGHDTTAAGINHALLLLAQHVDVQGKIIAELDEIFGDSKRHATYDDLQNMKYLERCLKECLRIYPSVPFIVRHTVEDIPLTKHVAPVGSDIFIHIYNIHRDPRYFPNPEKFDPDRFLPENSKGRHPYAYIPFSAGPRNCIGQKFAMLELKSILSSIFRNFTLEAIATPQNLKWVADIVLRVEGPINIKFKPRSDIKSI